MFRSRIVSLMIAAGMITLVSSVAYGQRFEVGVGGGASLYNSKTLTTPSGDISAKFKPGYTFSGFLGQIGGRLGGEIRYSYMSNEMELAGLGKSYTMGGRSQAIHYDVHIYANKNKEAKFRPYFLVGGGMKQFTGTGSAVALQPLGNGVEERREELLHAWAGAVSVCGCGHNGGRRPPFQHKTAIL